MLKKVVVVVPYHVNNAKETCELSFKTKGLRLSVFNNERGELIVTDVKDRSPEKLVNKDNRDHHHVDEEEIAVFKEWSYWRKIEEE